MLGIESHHHCGTRGSFRNAVLSAGQGGGQIKRLLQSHEPALRAAAKGLTLPADARGKSSNGAEEDRSDYPSFPRYARINTLKQINKEAIIKQLTTPSTTTAEEDDAVTSTVLSSTDIKVRHSQSMERNNRSLILLSLLPILGG